MKCKVTAKTINGQVSALFKYTRFGPLVFGRFDVRTPGRRPMVKTRIRTGSSLDIFELARCCAEAQADGVPCPTLGRSCEICERAVRSDAGDEPPPPIRPVGRD